MIVIRSEARYTIVFISCQSAKQFARQSLRDKKSTFEPGTIQSMARKFLIVRFSSIGDIVLTTPVIRGLKKQIPGAEVHFLTKSAYSGILKANPYVDCVYEIRKDTGEVIDLLKGESYELVIDLHHNLRTMLLKAQLNRPSVAFRKLNLEKWLLVNLKWNRMPGLHIVERYMETVGSLGVTYDGAGLDFFIQQGQEVEPGHMPPGFSDGYYAAVVGARHATKRLPVEKWNELIKSIGKPVVILGGPEDHDTGSRLHQMHPGLVWNSCGLFSLAQSASLVKQARCVVTNDTGLMHIAAAFRQRIISLWGNTVPEFGMVPFLPAGQGASIIMEQKSLSCRPCSKIGFDKCPKGHFRCMMDQNLIAAASQVKTWFSD